MMKSTFLWQEGALRNRLLHESTSMRDPISVEEQIAIALWYLANTTSYRLIGQLFGLGKLTVATIVIEVCVAMEAELYSMIVRLGPPGRESSLTFYPHPQSSTTSHQPLLTIMCDVWVIDGHCTAFINPCHLPM